MVVQLPIAKNSPRAKGSVREHKLPAYSSVLPYLAIWCKMQSMSRREYKAALVINNVVIDKVIIDSHYEEKHAESINDEIILELVKTLNGKLFEPEDIKTPYSYFVTDKIKYSGKLYKLIWLLEENEIYIGVINAYRR